MKHYHAIKELLYCSVYTYCYHPEQLMQTTFNPLIFIYMNYINKQNTILKINNENKFVDIFFQ